MCTSSLVRQSVLQCVALCVYVFKCFGAVVKIQIESLRILTLVCVCVLQCVAVCCSVLQCVAVCCSVLQCVAGALPVGCT